MSLMLLLVLWHFALALPAFAANMIPIVAARFNWFSMLDHPLDGGAEFRGKRVFGANKTWRGLILGGILGGVFGVIYYHVDQQFPFISVLDGIAEFVMFGFLGGVGALLGDAVESFFKRQIGIKPGRPFIPFDQIDYLLGFVMLTYVLIPWSWSQVALLCAFGLVLNPIINILAYAFRIKKTYW